MNYEQKYKETLERAKTLYENANGLIKKKWIEQVFPELKESEDERIRKAIIDYFNLQDDNTTYSFMPKKDIINWLEKQGEKKPKWTEEDEKNFNNIDIILFEYKNLPKENYWKIINWIMSLKQRMGNND